MSVTKNPIILSVSFVAASIAAGYCIFGLQARRGFLDLTAIPGAEKITPPSEDGSLRNPFASRQPAVDTFTGVEDVDHHAVGMVRFFWLIVTGDSVALTAFSIDVEAQLVALNVVMGVEAIRAGNSGTAIAWPYLWMVLYQLASWGATMPLYWLVYLLTSPLAKTGSKTTSRSLLPARPTDLFALTLSIILTSLAPIVLLLPIFDPVVRQRGIILWNFFPLSQLVVETALARTIPLFVDNGRVSTAQAYRWLRRTYAAGLAFATVIHLATLAFTFQQSYSSLGTVDFATMFLPIWPLGPAPQLTLETVADGALTLIQYDTYFATGASIAWTFIMGNSFSVSSLAQLVISIVVMGPAGAVLAWVASRDAQVLESELGLTHPGRLEDKKPKMT